MDGDQSTEELMEQGLAALEIAEFNDAIESFGSAAVEAPENPHAWFYLGLCYLETGEPDLSIEALNRAIAVEPGYADAHYLLGTAKGAMGQLNEASLCYRRALEIDPHHYKAEEFLIRTEGLLASLEHYSTAMKLIYEEERGADWLNTAIRELLHSVAIFPESPARNEFARLAKEISESEQRVLSDDEVLGSPLWTGAINQAQKAFSRRNWTEASSYYNEALDLSSQQAFIHHVLGLIYFALGDVESGIQAWRRTLDADPDYDFARAGFLKKDL